MTIQEFDYITGTDQLCLVQFHAEWCGPCKMMMPIVKEVSAMFGEQLQVVQIDVDIEQEIAQEFYVSSVPTFMLMANNDIIWRQSGALPKMMLVKEIDETLRSLQ